MLRFAMKKILLAFALVIISLPALAKPQTVTLDLPTMNCAMCPVTVKKALNKVEGVTFVEVRYKKKRAVVTFEDTRTSATALVEATTNAGYPSTIVSEKKR